MAIVVVLQPLTHVAVRSPVLRHARPGERTPVPHYEPISHGPRGRRSIALTFDADMTVAMLRRSDMAFDESIVAELRQTGTPATFFVSGLWARARPAALDSLARDPLFEIGNHTLSHRAFTSPCFELPVVTSEAEKRFEIIAADAVIAGVTGTEPRFFRFPGGCYAQDDLQLVGSLGKQAVQWDVASGDAFEPDPEIVASRVLARTRPGSIVVMHLNGAPNAPATSSALKMVIPALRRRGLEMVTVGRLLQSC